MKKYKDNSHSRKALGEIRNILIVAHDAGGAQIISAYIKKFKDKYNFKCLVLGPAISIFKRKKIIARLRL